MIVQLKSNMQLQCDTDYLCNRYENNRAEITVNLPIEYCNANYYYYILCNPPDGTIQFSIPLLLDVNKLKYVVGSNVSSIDGSWEFAILIKSVAIVNNNIGTDGLIAITPYFTGRVLKGFIEKTQIENAPMDVNLKIVYDDLLALSSKLGGDLENIKALVTQVQEHRNISEQAANTATNAFNDAQNLLATLMNLKNDVDIINSQIAMFNISKADFDTKYNEYITKYDYFITKYNAILPTLSKLTPEIIDQVSNDATYVKNTKAEIVSIKQDIDLKYNDISDIATLKPINIGGNNNIRMIGEITNYAVNNNFSLEAMLHNLYAFNVSDLSNAFITVGKLDNNNSIHGKMQILSNYIPNYDNKTKIQVTDTGKIYAINDPNMIKCSWNIIKKTNNVVIYDTPGVTLAVNGNVIWDSELNKTNIVTSQELKQKADKRYSVNNSNYRNKYIKLCTLTPNDMSNYDAIYATTVKGTSLMIEHINVNLRFRVFSGNDAHSFICTYEPRDTDNTNNGSIKIYKNPNGVIEVYLKTKYYNGGFGIDIPTLHQFTVNCSLTIGDYTYTDIEPIGTLLYDSSTKVVEIATTGKIEANLSTVGWKRFASISTDVIGRAFAVFSLGTMFHTNPGISTTFIVNVNYNNISITPIGTIIGSTSDIPIPKVRAVYLNNYCYLEFFYNTTGLNGTIVQMSNSVHIALLDSFIDGSVPTGYNVKEVSLSNIDILWSGSVSTNGASINITETSIAKYKKILFTVRKTGDWDCVCPVYPQSADKFTFTEYGFVNNPFGSLKFAAGNATLSFQVIPAGCEVIKVVGVYN